MGSPRLFINYRREDTGPTASRLAEALAEILEVGEVFIDHRNIEPGTPWPDELRKELARASVVLALIGDRWLMPADDGLGLRRIDGDGDWVREEILAGGVSEGTCVLPVYVEEVVPPPPAAFPRDPKMAAFAALQGLKLRRTEWKSDLERLLEFLAEHGFRRREGELPGPDAGPVDVLATYRAYLRSVHSQLVQLFPEAQSRTLDEVFVELEVGIHGLSRHYGFSTEDVWLTLGQVSPSELREAPDRGVRVSQRPSLRELLALPRQAWCTRRWAVLGDPGAGKSTIARHLAWELAGEADGPIPVYLPIPRWERGRHPFEVAEDELRGARGDIGAAGLTTALRTAASTPGRVWILLDGLDEVAPEHIADVRDRICGLAGALEHATICVLSRLVGYLDTSKDFLRANLRPLDRDAQKRLLRRWLGDTDGAAVWKRLETREPLLSLASNPLLLTLVAHLAKLKKDLPRNRHELYSQAIDLLLERGHGASKGVANPSSARKLLQELARQLQESAAPTWSKDELVDALLKVLDDDMRRRLKDAWENSDAFLDDVATNSGVLRPDDALGGKWGFLHRQFREFLAAEALKRRGENAWLGRAKALVGDRDKQDHVPRWAETLALLAGMVEDPLALLTRLREVSADLVLRTLPDVDGIEPSAMLAFLVGTAGWDGLHLLEVVRGFGVVTEAERDAVADLLWRLVETEASIHRLACVHWVMGEIGRPPNAGAFFERAGRPRANAGIEFVAIPAGPFLMGSPEGEKGRYADEGPQHEVLVAGFAVAATAVTNEQYRRFDPDHEPERWRGVSESELSNHPVVNVSWWEARLYCAWAGCRLPSEAEWEHACRAGTTTRFWSGDGEGDLGAVGWFGDNSGGRTHTVGELSRPNEFGLHDMHGDVDEWCEDAWHDSYVAAPANGSAWLTGGSDLRVIRGGSWDLTARGCRSACRHRVDPGLRLSPLGFRPARS